MEETNITDVRLHGVRTRYVRGRVSFVLDYARTIGETSLPKNTYILHITCHESRKWIHYKGELRYQRPGHLGDEQDEDGILTNSRASSVETFVNIQTTPQKTSKFT